jgi:hypothetical protein
LVIAAAYPGSRAAIPVWKGPGIPEEVRKMKVTTVPALVPAISIHKTN